MLFSHMRWFKERNDASFETDLKCGTLISENALTLDQPQRGPLYTGNRKCIQTRSMNILGYVGEVQSEEMIVFNDMEQSVAESLKEQK